MGKIFSKNCKGKFFRKIFATMPTKKVQEKKFKFFFEKSSSWFCWKFRLQTREFLSMGSDSSNVFDVPYENDFGRGPQTKKLWAFLQTWTNVCNFCELELFFLDQKSSRTCKPKTLKNLKFWRSSRKVQEIQKFNFWKLEEKKPKISEKTTSFVFFVFLNFKVQVIYVHVHSMLCLWLLSGFYSVIQSLPTNNTLKISEKGQFFLKYFVPIISVFINVVIFPRFLRFLNSKTEDYFTNMILLFIAISFSTILIPIFGTICESSFFFSFRFHLDSQFLRIPLDFCFRFVLWRFQQRMFQKLAAFVVKWVSKQSFTRLLKLSDGKQKLFSSGLNLFKCNRSRESFQHWIFNTSAHLHSHRKRNLHSEFSLRPMFAINHWSFHKFLASTFHCHCSFLTTLETHQKFVALQELKSWNGFGNCSNLCSMRNSILFSLCLILEIKRKKREKNWISDWNLWSFLVVPFHVCLLYFCCHFQRISQASNFSKNTANKNSLLKSSLQRKFSFLQIFSWFVLFSLFSKMLFSSFFVFLLKVSLICFYFIENEIYGNFLIYSFIPLFFILFIAEILDQIKFYQRFSMFPSTQKQSITRISNYLSIQTTKESTKECQQILELGLLIWKRLILILFLWIFSFVFWEVLQILFCQFVIFFVNLQQNLIWKKLILKIKTFQFCVFKSVLFESLGVFLTNKRKGGVSNLHFHSKSKNELKRIFFKNWFEKAKQNLCFGKKFEICFVLFWVEIWRRFSHFFIFWKWFSQNFFLNHSRIIFKHSLKTKKNSLSNFCDSFNFVKMNAFVILFVISFSKLIFSHRIFIPKTEEIALKQFFNVTNEHTNSFFKRKRFFSSMKWKSQFFFAKAFLALFLFILRECCDALNFHSKCWENVFWSWIKFLNQNLKTHEWKFWRFVLKKNSLSNGKNWDHFDKNDCVWKWIVIGLKHPNSQNCTHDQKVSYIENGHVIQMRQKLTGFLLEKEWKKFFFQNSKKSFWLSHSIVRFGIESKHSTNGKVFWKNTQKFASKETTLRDLSWISSEIFQSSFQHWFFSKLTPNFGNSFKFYKASKIGFNFQ